MTATVSAVLVTTAAPVEFAKPDGSNVVYITAREPDVTRRWEMWGVSATARAAIGKLAAGDTVEVTGALSVKLEQRLAILQVVVRSCEMRLPIGSPKIAVDCTSSVANDSDVLSPF
jgi:hypothetical protein